MRLLLVFLFLFTALTARSDAATVTLGSYASTETIQVCDRGYCNPVSVPVTEHLVRIVPGGDEAVDLAVAYDRDARTVTVTGAVTGGSGCEQTEATAVRCTAPADPGDAIMRVYARLGSGNDRLAITGAAPPNPIGYGAHALLLRTEILGGAGDDVLAGSAGPDRLLPGPGRDVVDGGAGADTVVADEGGDTLDLTGAGAGGADVIMGVETAQGGAGPDRLVGAPGVTRLDGAGGNDVIASPGPAQVACGDGTDHVAGSGLRTVVRRDCESVGGARVSSTIPRRRDGALRLALGCESCTPRVRLSAGPRRLGVVTGRGRHRLRLSKADRQELRYFPLVVRFRGGGGFTVAS